MKNCLMCDVETTKTFCPECEAMVDAAEQEAEDAFLESGYEDTYEFYSDEGDPYAGTYSEM